MLRLLLISVLFSFAWGKAIPDDSLDDEGKIVGGEATTIEKYPYQVSIQKYNRHFCGGSLIKPNVVVSAAHCTYDAQSPSSITVRAGHTRRDQGGTVIGAAKIANHPKYSSSAVDYDESVILLQSPFSIGAGIQTVPLQPQGVEVPTGTYGTVTGWGTLSYGGQMAEILQVVQVPRVSHADCQAAYGQITDRMICFGLKQGGKDACQGDSGGPVVANGNLAGIVSFGYECARENYPGVYAKVSNPEIYSHIVSSVREFGESL